MSFYMVFQFHKGTIKTAYQKIYQDFYRKFQFHKGTIKTPQKIIISSHLYHFNSIKVQLKPILTQTKMSLYTMGFQMQRYKKYFKKMSMSNDIFSAVLRQPAYLWRSQ